MNKEEIAQVLNEQSNHLCQQLMNRASEQVMLPPSGQQMTTLHVLKEKAALQIQAEFKTFQDDVKQGMDAILMVLQENKVPLDEQMQNWRREHFDEILSLTKGEINIADGLVLQNAIHFPDELLKMMYCATIYLYQQHRNEDALKAITICLLLNGLVPQFWLLYGAILQSKNEHENALHAYQMTILLKENDPYPYAHMAKSWAALGTWNEAAAAINKALSLCDSHSNHELFSYCQSLQQYIKKKGSRY